jgi:hypothetical protein
VLFLLQCLQPLETCRQGLLALVPHVPLLQRAAAALSTAPVSEQYLHGQQRDSQQWAEQIGEEARAELAATKREHAAAWRELQCALVGVAEQQADYRASAAAAAADAGEDGQQQHAAVRGLYASLAAAVDQLAIALPRAVELQQLLQLTEGAPEAAAAGGAH